MLCFHSCMGRVSPQEAQKAHPIGPLKPSKIAMLLFLLLPLPVQRSRHCLARLNLAWPGNHDVASTVPFISTNKVDQNEVMAPQPSATTVPSLGKAVCESQRLLTAFGRVSHSHMLAAKRMLSEAQIKPIMFSFYSLTSMQPS
jgi:hypothetical protein